MDFAYLMTEHYSMHNYFIRWNLLPRMSHWTGSSFMEWFDAIRTKEYTVTSLI